MSQNAVPMPGQGHTLRTCRICGDARLEQLTAREMMFGTRDVFTYFECKSCGCVQIAEYPTNIGRYYPAEYYSFHAAASIGVPVSWRGRAKEWVAWQVLSRSRRLAARHLQSDAARKVITRSPLLSIYRDYLPGVGSRILDVGCGAGELVKELRLIHYYQAFGADPYIPHDIQDRGRLLVRKAWLHEVEGTFDCVSFHHVLEHMPHQLEVLRKTRTLLSPAGLAIVRVPVAGSHAWKRYRENWVQLDAPRHFYLHSENSLRMIADRAGFDVRAVVHDSTAMQFWGSELYLRDIPLTDSRSPAAEGPSVFSEAELTHFATQAGELNAAGCGDQLLAVLAPKRG